MELGKDLQNSDSFPEGINFGVAQIISEDEINLKFMKEVQEKPWHAEVVLVRLQS